jgi:hypothetical protein
MQQVCLDKIQQWFDAGRFQEARRLLNHLIGYDRCKQDLAGTADPIPQILQDWAVRLETAIASSTEEAPRSTELVVRRLTESAFLVSLSQT